MTILQTLIGLIVVQRMLELALARRNNARLRARGGIELAAGHHALYVALQIGWLMALAVAVPAGRQPFPVLIGLFGLLQLVRLWAILSLGDYWTTRLFVLSEPPVRHGPYRFLAHPDYMVTTAEIALLPLAFGAWGVALGFTLANAVLLAHRVRLEDRVLAARALTELPAGGRVRPVRKAA
jgi:methyltransferase